MELTICVLFSEEGSISFEMQAFDKVIGSWDVIDLYFEETDYGPTLLCSCSFTSFKSLEYIVFKGVQHVNNLSFEFWVLPEIFERENITSEKLSTWIKRRSFNDKWSPIMTQNIMLINQITIQDCVMEVFLFGFRFARICAKYLEKCSFSTKWD